MRKKNTNHYGTIESYIDSYRKAHDGRCPSVREIGASVGISPATVTRYMRDMKEQGVIEYEGHRNIKTASSIKESTETVSVPVLGRVSCGVPKLAEENIEEYVKLPVSVFGKGEYYILRANGDSMVGAGIYDGDLVLVEKKSNADVNQIVVALVGDEATLKRLKMREGTVYLHPENEMYQDIPLNDGIIQGVAKMVIKEIA